MGIVILIFLFLIIVCISLWSSSKDKELKLASREQFIVELDDCLEKLTNDLEWLGDTDVLGTLYQLVSFKDYMSGEIHNFNEGDFSIDDLESLLINDFDERVEIIKNKADDITRKAKNIKEKIEKLREKVIF